MNHLTGYLAKTHRSELSNEAEVERLLRKVRSSRTRFGDRPRLSIRTRLASLSLKLHEAAQVGLYALRKGAEMLRILMVAAVVLGLFGVLYTTPSLAKVAGSEASGSEQTKPTPSASDYPKLDLVLFQLTQATDPARFATEHHLNYTQGRVEVSIELQGDALPSGYHLEIISQSKDRVAAWVLLQELLLLAKEQNVRAVRASLVPATGNQGGGSKPQQVEP